MNYKEYVVHNIGSSDVAALILAGYMKGEGFCVKKLPFSQDGSYQAYIVDENAQIGEHYTKVAEYDSWVKIYDDTSLIRTYVAEKIILYRAARMGCIIQLIDSTDN